MRAASLTSFGLVFLLVQPVAAQTSSFALGTPGIISGIAVYPSAVSVYAQATISVAGAGQCGGVIINFGDGSPEQTLSSVTFPAGVVHKYSKAGSFVIRASPGSNCNAATPITTTVNVEGSTVDLLCALTGCDDDNARAAPCLKPTIKSVVYTPPLEPGESLIVSGCGFGDPAARAGVRKLNLKGAFPAAGTAVPLQILTWSETAVMAKVPMVKGVKDQNAWLQIESEPNTSNQIPVSFRATRVIRGLYYIEKVIGLTADPKAWGNKCSLTHSSCIHVNPGNTTASGVDALSITLGNGWVIERQAFYHGTAAFEFIDWAYYMVTLDEKDPVFDASKFVRGAPTGVLRISWTTGPADWSAFHGSIYVKGPRCVPVAEWVTWPGTDPLMSGLVCFSMGDKPF